MSFIGARSALTMHGRGSAGFLGLAVWDTGEECFLVSHFYAQNKEDLYDNYTS